MADRDRNFMDPNKWYVAFKDGMVAQYDRALHFLAMSMIDGAHFAWDATNFLWLWFFKDGTQESYDSGAHVWQHKFMDGSVFTYDAGQKAYSAALAAGASYSISLNGATVNIDSSGNINMLSPGTVSVNGAIIALAGGGPPVARVGDRTVCPAGPGTIVSGSPKVFSG